MDTKRRALIVAGRLALPAMAAVYFLAVIAQSATPAAAEEGKRGTTAWPIEPAVPTPEILTGTRKFHYGPVELDVNMDSVNVWLRMAYGRVDENPERLLWCAIQMNEHGKHEAALATMQAVAEAFELSAQQIDAYATETALALSSLGHTDVAAQFLAEIARKYRGDRRKANADIPLGAWLRVRLAWLQCHQAELSGDLKEAAEATRKYAREHEEIIDEATIGKPAPLACFSIASALHNAALFARAAGQWDEAAGLFRATRSYTKAHLDQIKADRPAMVETLLVPARDIAECYAQARRPEDPYLTLRRQVYYPIAIAPIYQNPNKSAAYIRWLEGIAQYLEGASTEVAPKEERQYYAALRKDLPDRLVDLRTQAIDRALRRSRYLSDQGKAVEALRFWKDWFDQYGDEGFMAIASHFEVATLYQRLGNIDQALKELAKAASAVPVHPDPDWREPWRERIAELRSDLEGRGENQHPGNYHE